MVTKIAWSSADEGPGVALAMKQKPVTLSLLILCDQGIQVGQEVELAPTKWRVTAVAEAREFCPEAPKYDVTLAPAQRERPG